MISHISVIIVTRDEEKNLSRCLASLEAFENVIVVDSQSTDNTINIAKKYFVRVENFIWNKFLI